MVKGGNIEFEGGEELGVEAWNIADGYTKLKILKHVVLLDKYETIARFGVEEVDLDFGLEDNQIQKKRIEGLERFAFILKQLIGNISFALKQKRNNDIQNYMKRIENVEEFIDKSYDVSQDLVTHSEKIKIEEDLFKTCLKILSQIKNEINVPMNEAQLIFKTSDEIDLDAMMKYIALGG